MWKLSKPHDQNFKPSLVGMLLSIEWECVDVSRWEGGGGRINLTGGVVLCVDLCVAGTGCSKVWQGLGGQTMHHRVMIVPDKLGLGWDFRRFCFHGAAAVGSQMTKLLRLWWDRRGRQVKGMLGWYPLHLAQACAMHFYFFSVLKKKKSLSIYVFIYLLYWFIYFFHSADVRRSLSVSACVMMEMCINCSSYWRRYSIYVCSCHLHDFQPLDDTW